MKNYFLDEGKIMGSIENNFDVEEIFDYIGIKKPLTRERQIEILFENNKRRREETENYLRNTQAFRDYEGADSINGLSLEDLKLKYKDI
ncbi:MAG TPA: hypothetical protein HA283_05860 [Nanoarchaeota archaeon]|nr:hypothetical protein [Nanoarchaeota archaeon]HIH63795.1 hypothetical protein [Nanoarchaeota archaeon]HIJ09668.1 hypothetical protein [Nanoarchaeota archaeon]